MNFIKENLLLCKRNLLFIIFSSALPPRHILMLNFLKKQGWHISVIAWDRNGDSPIPDQYGNAIDDWKWICLPAPTWSLKLITKLPRYYFKLWKVLGGNDSADVVFLSHILLLPLVLFIRRKKKVYDAVEMYALELSFYFGPFKNVAFPIISLAERMIVKLTDGVLTVDSKSGWLEQYYRRSIQDVQVIWNVPSLDDDPDTATIELLRTQYQGRSVIAFVGGLMRVKGLRIAMQAASLIKQDIPDVLFLFIGPMKDQPEGIQKLIVDLELQDHISILAPMPYRRLLSHLAHASIGLALHQNERVYSFVSAGNGRKFFTYMQASLAIVGPDFGEVGRAVELAGCGILVDTSDSEAVAGAIIELMTDPEKLAQMQHKARTAFEARFCWEFEKEKFYNFMEKLDGR